MARKADSKKNFNFTSSNNKKSTSQSQQTPRQEPFFEKELRKKRNLQQTTQNDYNCGLKELYVAYANDGREWLQYEINDIKIREKDRMQYVTGTYYMNNLGWNVGQYPWQRLHCFIAKYTSRGDFQEGMYMDPNTGYNDDGGDHMKCNALALVPRTDNVIAVGYWADSNFVWLYGMRASLLIFADSTLSKIVTKTWIWNNDVYSYGDSEAKDVTVAEGDGSIYVTGHLRNQHTRKGWTNSPALNRWDNWLLRTADHDCYVLKLDADLNRVYAKSFGFISTDTNKMMTCMSIQVTRNSDHIYVGGNSDGGIFFGKAITNFQQITMTKLTHPGETLTMRRIMLERNKKVGTEKLYFCGFTTSSSGDMIFGRVSSPAGWSATNIGTIQIDITYQYGSPDTESIGDGDCKLSEDNSYIIGLFTTNHQIQRTFGIDYDIRVDYQDPDDSPWDGACNYNTNYNSFLPNHNSAGAAKVQNRCQSGLASTILDYVKDYEDKIYSWRTCNDYHYYTWQANCRIKSVSFPSTPCPQNPGFGLNCQCPNAGFLQDIVDYLNQQLRWYSEAQFSTNKNECVDRQLQNNVLSWIFSQPTGPGFPTGRVLGQTYPNPRSYMYCQQAQNGHSQTYKSACTVNTDQVEWIFEQDCTEDIVGNPKKKAYSNWFIYRVPTNLLDQGLTAQSGKIPEQAVNFGDRRGNFVGRVLAVDRYGYIYVHGYSDSQNFGGWNSYENNGGNQRYSWVHGKTHWEMTYEVQCNEGHASQDQYTCSDQYYATYFDYFTYFPLTFTSNTNLSDSYFGLKFRRPLKFNNNHNPPTNFLKTIYARGIAGNPGTIVAANSMYPYEMNEDPLDTNYITSPGPFYSYNTAPFSATIVPNQVKFSTNYMMMNFQQSDIWILKANSQNPNIYEQSVSLNTACLQNDPTYYSAGMSWLYTQRQNFFDKVVQVRDFPSQLSTYFDVTINPNTTKYLHINGTLNNFPNANEGIYYFTLNASAQTVYTQFSYPFTCPFPFYGFFQDSYDFPGFNRFQISQRIKVIVDVEAIPPPSLITDIPTQYPVIRQRTEITSLSTRNFANCDLYYVKRSKYKGSTYNAWDYTLPNWIKFFETNTSFVMYPPDTKNIITVEVSCCNYIGQCATSEFEIRPKTTPPVNILQNTIPTYTIQYDSNPNVTNVGSAFTWAMRKTQFYDPDKSNDLQDTKYYVTDHRVSIEFYNQGSTDYLRYRQVNFLGIMYWQGFPSNLGMNTIPYRYHDKDSSTVASPQYSQFILIVNQKPYRTWEGLLALLPAMLDPCKESDSSYFDQWFPFLKDQAKDQFSIDTTNWFAQKDTDSLFCSMTMNDRLLPPNWMVYNTTSCQLYGEPALSDVSALLNLRFAVADGNQGEEYLHKPLLVNCRPKNRVSYVTVYMGINRKVSYNLSNLAYDVDKDSLSYSFPSNDDQKRLQTYGLYLQDENKAIAGRPILPGTIAMLKIRASDPHGSYADIFMTIKIDDYVPKRRSSTRQKIYKDDVYITEGQYFELQLPDDIYYDAQGQDPLVFFASNDFENPLPDWLVFNPLGRLFYGVPPMGFPRQLNVKVYALNQYTHDQVSFMFTLHIIENAFPKIDQPNYSHDVVVRQGDWFDHTLWIEILDDKETNRQQVFEMTTKSDWITFTPENRSFHGFVDPTLAPLGLHRLTLTFVDDQNYTTYMNIKFTVLPPLPPFSYTPLILVITSCFLASASYLYYAHLTNMDLEAENVEEEAKQVAGSRFNGFLDVNVRLQNVNELGYKIGERIDRVRYRRSQTNKRVLGKAGGIKFEGNKKVRVPLPSFAFQDLVGNPLNDDQNQLLNQTGGTALNETFGEATAAFMNASRKNANSMAIKIDEGGSLSQSSPSKGFIDEESRISQFIQKSMVFTQDKGPSNILAGAKDEQQKKVDDFLLKGI